jgi:exopolysaccharide biosynthesis polyprenyl glycosylphosphotransferase
MLSIREKKVLFAASDLMQLGVAAGLALGGVWLGSPATPDELLPQMIWVAVMGAALLIGAYLNDCLDVTSLNSRTRYLRRWGISWLIATGVYLLGFFVLGRPASVVPTNYELPRLIPGLFLVLALITVPAGRATLERWFGLGSSRKACVVVGAGGSGQHFVENVAAHHGEWEILAIVDDDPAKLGLDISGVKVVGDSTKLLWLVEEHSVQEVVLAITNGMSRSVIDALLVCFERGIDVVPVMVASERTLGRIPIKHLGDKWLPTTFWASATMPLFYRVVKRAMDVGCSVLLLLVASPLLVVGALATKLTSQGPIIYTQRRVGTQGRIFSIYKIRTMVENAESAGAQWATRDDLRITPVGRILRLSRIDELPQLFNVLRGDMSLIGPRPERPEFVEMLAQEIPYYRARHCVKPGLTGWAQIMYRYGNSVDDSKVKLEYDLFYIKNRSVLLDLMIGLRTLKTVVLMRGT